MKTNDHVSGSQALLTLLAGLSYFAVGTTLAIGAWDFWLVFARKDYPSLWYGMTRFGGSGLVLFVLYLTGLSDGVERKDMDIFLWVSTSLLLLGVGSVGILIHRWQTRHESG